MSQLKTNYSDAHSNETSNNLTDCQYLRPNQRSANEITNMRNQNESIPLRQIEHFSAFGKRINNLDTSNSTEEETLLSPGPVKFTTCWESQIATNDDLNFKSAFNTFEKQPIDRFNLVFFIFILHGIGILMPWNMFTTAKAYFEDYKLNPNVTDGVVVGYRDHFMSYLGIASQVPNVICNALNLFLQFGGDNLTFRIVGSIFVEVIIFIITVILAMVDSSAWPGVFFYITMISVVILNMANGVYQNSVYGLAAKLPMKYTMAIVLGTNVSGVFISLLSIMSIAASPSIRTAAIYYFITALFVLLACLDTYFALPLIRFYRYHEKLHKKSNSRDICESGNSPYWKVFKKAWPQCFNVFFIFFVTLTIYPAVHSNIRRIDENFIIPEKYFAPVTCYLCFNFFAMMGSMFSNWFTWPGPRFLWIPVILRFLMVPYFMLCNYKPEKRVLPVLINNDWAYFGVSILFGLTSGYFSSLAMMYAPRCVKPEHASTAGMMAALFLVLGIVCGVNFTFFVSWLVETSLFDV